MKRWQQIMVVVVAIILVSTIYATQYMAVSTDASLSVDTQTSGLQIAASDPSVDANDHEHLLEYDNDGFNANLATWGEQNTFKSSQAFLIANAGDNPIMITGASVTGDAGLVENMNIYLQDGAEGRTLGDGQSVQVWDGTDDPSSDDVYLNSVVSGDSGIDDPYLNDNLQVWHEGTATDDDTAIGEAVWASSTNTDGEGDELWNYNSTVRNDEGTPETFDFSTTESVNSNAVWVYIEVDPTGVTEGDYTGTLEFFVEDA